MPWCPKCKSEYREGIVKCADCKIDLVEELPPDNENPYSEEAQMQQMQQWVLDDTVEEPVEEAVEDSSEPEKEDSIETKIRNARMAAASDPVRVYTDKKSKAEDFKSSGYTFFQIGSNQTRLNSIIISA